MLTNLSLFCETLSLDVLTNRTFPLIINMFIIFSRSIPFEQNVTFKLKHGLSCFLHRLILVTPSTVTSSNLFLPTSPKFGLKIGLDGNVAFPLRALYSSPLSKLAFVC